MIGRQLPLFSIIIPGFMIFVMAGWRGMTQVMPAVLTAGISFAVTQFITANFLGPILVDVLSALVCLAALVGLLRVWQPSVVWRFEDEPEEGGESREAPAGGRPATGPASGFAAGGASFGGSSSSFQAFLPYIILVVVVIIAKIGTISKSIPDWLNVTALLQKATVPIEWPGLHNLVIRVPPIVPSETPYPAVYSWDILNAAGTVVLFAAVLAGFVMGASPATQLRVYGRTLRQLALAILTIAMILALAYVMNYSGATSTLGLAFAGTGLLFPFFSAFIGWLGVVLSGSDTSSNSLFGPMQTITAQQLGVEPALAGATNSSGGVMGKMISPQNLTVGASAIGQVGREPDIFRMTLKWSLILTVAMGILAMI
jgi:L-lactate permease